MFLNYIVSLGVGWLALLILEVGAMLRPDSWDKHEGIHTHVLFFNFYLIIKS